MSNTNTSPEEALGKQPGLKRLSSAQRSLRRWIARDRQ